MQTGYSLDNARRFAWSSVSGELNAERVSHLEKYAIGKTVLDAGCGGGAFVDFMCRLGFEASGIDLHDEFLTVTKERGYQGTFFQGDLTALPFADKSFDFTYCFDVLEHVDDAAALCELARVTRRRILAAVPRTDDAMGPFSLTFRHYQDTTHLRTYTEETLRRLAESVHPDRIEVFPELPVPTGELARYLMQLDLHAARLYLETAVRNGGVPEPPPGGLSVPPVTPDIPRQGIRSRIKAWAGADAFVQEAFANAYREAFRDSDSAAYKGVIQESFARFQIAFQEAVNARFEAEFNPFIEVLLSDDAHYRTIYTGLVVVLDLGDKA